MTSLDKFKQGLISYHDGNLPISYSDFFKLSIYIVEKIKEWFENNNLLFNNDAEVFYYCLKMKFDEFESMLLNDNN